jgi:hypothetical protein
LNIKPSHEGPVDIIIWVCLYGGLLSVVSALAVSRADEEIAWWLGIGGSLVTALGVILIYIRSRTK